jgi:PST family polysaccharide transporter
MTLRVITWPMGFMLLAKGKVGLTIWTELAFTLVNVGLSWICVRTFSLTGVGIAFFASYIVHGLMLYPIVRHLTRFHWSAANRRTGSLFLAVIAAVFCASQVLSPLWAMAIGTLAVVGSGVYSIRTLLTLVPLNRMPHSARRFLALFGVTPSGAGL